MDLLNGHYLFSPFPLEHTYSLEKTYRNLKKECLGETGDHGGVFVLLPVSSYLPNSESIGDST